MKSYRRKSGNAVLRVRKDTLLKENISIYKPMVRKIITLVTERGRGSTEVTCLNYSDKRWINFSSIGLMLSLNINILLSNPIKPPSPY